MASVIEIVDSDDDMSMPRIQTIIPGLVLKVDRSSPPITQQITPPPVKTPRQRNRRKSMHQTLRASPNMHFETITLDDEDASNKIGQRRTEKPSTSAAQKIVKPQPKLAVKIPVDDITSIPLNTYPMETIVRMREIAEERVRTNYLLMMFGMPKIDFTTATNIEQWKAEFKERLKARQAHHESLDSNEDMGNDVGYTQNPKML